MKKKLISNIRVYGENQVYSEGYVLLHKDKIIEVGSMEELELNESVEIIKYDESYSLIPGMIDLHIHGAAGADTMDATIDAINTISKFLPREGTTSFLATTMTSTKDKIENALRNIGEYQNLVSEPSQAEVLGVHLEGPFISPKRAGAQHPDHIILPDVELFIKWQSVSGDHIKLVTLAPEQPGGKELVTYLKNTNVRASIGHSDAVYTEVIDSISAGVTHATHLFNGMRGLHHREPGVVGGALINKEIMCEIIVDGIHIHPEMVKFIFNYKGKDGLILITDAIRAKGLGNGRYDLGGQEVTVTNNQARLEDGTLAGSILKFNQALRNMTTFTGCSISDLIQMGSVNPAKQIHVFDRKGSIKIGKDADLVIINQDLEVVMTFCRGNIVYKKNENF